MVWFRLSKQFLPIVFLRVIVCLLWVLMKISGALHGGVDWLSFVMWSEGCCVNVDNIADDSSVCAHSSGECEGLHCLWFVVVASRPVPFLKTGDDC